MQGHTDSNGNCTNIIITNVCRICQTQVTDGSHTSYMQQYEQQLKEGNLAPTPHSQIIHDLSDFIQECKSHGEEVILCLDANEELTKDGIPKTGSISQLTKDNAMICAHDFLGYSGGTSKLSGKRIDYILVTTDILPAIIRGGKRPFEEGIASDHKALFLDLDSEVLFGKSTGKIDLQ